MATKRNKYWATLVYPSDNPDWLEKLKATRIPCIVSPCHDKDIIIDGDDKGKPKKAHRHVMFIYDSLKSESQFKEVVNTVGAVGVISVDSARGTARYHTHIDYPDKAQYSASDEICLNGADYQALTYMPTDDYSILNDIIAYIEANNIIYFYDLVNLCRINNDEWFRYLTKHTIFVKEYMKSKDYKDRRSCYGDSYEKFERGALNE